MKSRPLFYHWQRVPNGTTDVCTAQDVIEYCDAVEDQIAANDAEIGALKNRTRAMGEDMERRRKRYEAVIRELKEAHDGE